MDVSVKSDLKNMLKKIKRELQQVPQEAFVFFKDTTPIKTGNAKRNTKLQNNVIKADYQYAEVLDKGRHMTSRGMRGSKQAPRGMTKPTEDFIKSRVNKKMQGK